MGICEERLSDITLMGVTERGNLYHASFSPDRHEMLQRRFLYDHSVKYVERERGREDILRAFFRGVELEGNPIETLTVRRVLDQPDYQSVRLTTRDDEMVLRFLPTWTFGQEQLLPVPPPHDEQGLQQEIALLLSYIRDGVLTLREAVHIVDERLSVRPQRRSLV